MGRLPFLLACLLAVPAAPAVAQERELREVRVKAMDNQIAKSYRRIVEGMDLFEQKHALAPAATLRFKVLPRRAETNMRNISLAVLGDTVTIPVRIEPDGTFVLARDEKALREDAYVMPDRRAGTMTWRTEIRTPGLPADTRRLGDLRLECEVGMEADLVSDERSFLSNQTRRRMGYCMKNPSRYLYFSERPLFGVTLVSGSRAQALQVEELYAGATHAPLDAEELGTCDCEVLLDRTYFLPLGDAAWPDDTLVRFEYMDGGEPSEHAGKTKAEIAAAFGARPLTARFPSGYEVWVFLGPESRDKRKERDELVVLFDPQGRVVKSRLRPGLSLRRA